MHLFNVSSYLRLWTFKYEIETIRYYYAIVVLLFFFFSFFINLYVPKSDYETNK